VATGNRSPGHRNTPGPDSGVAVPSGHPRWLPVPTTPPHGSRTGAHAEMRDRIPHAGVGGGRGLLLIAAREPVPGTTKTRLGAAIGMERAPRCTPPSCRSRRCALPPSGRRLGLRCWLGLHPRGVDFAGVLEAIGCPRPPAAVRFVPQQGEGWDVRQANLLRWGHDQGYGRTVLVASDSPQLPLASSRTPSRAGRGRRGHGAHVRRRVLPHRGAWCPRCPTGATMSTVTVADVLATRSAARGLTDGRSPRVFDIDEKGIGARMRTIARSDGTARARAGTWLRSHANSDCAPSI
jgi:hypothetical protein